ncbi:hypothetical protein BG011_009257 [Mortierella polycephala]|uniref:FH2 domain-containing protein n=1 Tax=Mortierella polycephala TaxID=41804 RepID=A0A9P6PLM5_9FUNG|nr:hypothetical protein BG011_009257 [Mortierella polycephala]
MPHNSSKAAEWDGPSSGLREQSSPPPPPPPSSFLPQQQQGAAGFRLHSLLKLRDVRSMDNKFNLMHYLANMATNTNPRLLNLPDEFSHLSKLEQYRTKDIMDQVLEHQKTIRKLASFQQRLERKVEELTKAVEEGVERSAAAASAAAALPPPPPPVSAFPRFNKDRRIELGARSRDQEVARQAFESAAAGEVERLKEEIVNAKIVVEKVEKFIKDAQVRFDDLVDLVEVLDESWRSTAIYFGEKSSTDVIDMVTFPQTSIAGTEDDAAAELFNLHQLQQQQQTVNRMLTGPRKPPEEIFGVIHEFFRHFREAHLQNEDILMRERRQATIAKRYSYPSSPSPAPPAAAAGSSNPTSASSRPPSPFAMAKRSVSRLL